MTRDVRQLSQTHAIIQSLRYNCMEVRNEAIQDAHERTFDWMFSPSVSCGADNYAPSAFVEWLRLGSGVYWITGKPSSGKSTLMKYLYNHDESKKFLCAWSGDVPLVRASFYFWNPGQEMQKSLEGLLQTLLYHVLHACPQMAPAICAERFKEQSSEADVEIRWTLVDLRAAFEALHSHPLVAAKFYFLVDGLDEYHGDSWEVISALQVVSHSPHIKLCLASRPWNCFQDAFGHSGPHMLRLHEWTRSDIELFARENLEPYITRSDSIPNRFDDLVRDIARRAQGVFLWVRLVVRSLRSGIINDDPVSILQERLREIPTDLEPFFEHILNSVEKVYKNRMANTFLAALMTHGPLTIINYHFLEQEDPTFGLHLPSEQWSPSQIKKIVLQTHRRINGRFKGLLEPASTADIGIYTPVDFLHRTLRDFLATERMLKWLQSCAFGELHVLVAISQALIATYKFVDPSPSLDDIRFSIEMASRAAKDTGDVRQGYDLVDMAEIVTRRARPEYSLSHTDCGIDCYLVFFAVAVGHTGYLHYRYQRDSASLNLNRLLKHAIRCRWRAGDWSAPSLRIHASSREANNEMNYRSPPIDWNMLNAPMIKSLLKLGADPNVTIDGFSSWAAFLGEATELMDGPNQEQCWETFQSFLRCGIPLRHKAFEWDKLLRRRESTSANGMQTTMDYMRQLLKHEMDPNLGTKGTTIFDITLQHYIATDSRLFPTETPESVAIEKLKAEMLRLFLHSGANPTLICRSEGFGKWLKIFSKRLMSCNDAKRTPSCIVELRNFLECGLDINTILHGNITIWYRLLGAIHESLQQTSRGKTLHQNLHQILLLCLKYTAEPDAPGLPRIMTWMRGARCLLSADEISEIERLLPIKDDEESDAGSKRPHSSRSQGHVSRRKGGDASTSRSVRPYKRSRAA